MDKLEHLFNSYWDEKFKEFILKYKEKDWNNTYAYLNSNISWNLFNDKELNKLNIFGYDKLLQIPLKKNCNLWIYIILYSKISINDILKLEAENKLFIESDIMWKLISRHKQVNIEYVLDNLDYDWNWLELSQHTNITMEDIEKNFRLPWLFKYVSNNPNVTYDFVEKYQFKAWCYYNLSRSKNLTWNNVFFNLDKNWCWKELTKNSAITLEIIDNNPDKPWDYDSIFMNKTIRKEIINKKFNYDSIIRNINKNGSLIYFLKLNFKKKQYKNINHWYLFSFDSNLTWNIIKESDINWNYDEIVSNSNITLDIIKKNPKIDWNMNSLSLNSSLTFKEINDNPNINWNWRNISQNEFTLQKKLYKLEFLRRWNATKKIQCHLKQCYYNPEYRICRERKLKQYENL